MNLIGRTSHVVNESSQNSSSEFVKPFTPEQVILVAVILLVFMILGIIGNTLTIYVIQNNIKLREDKFMWMIFSLCCSDLTSSCISWIFLYRRTWGFDDFHPIPPFLCKVFWATDAWTSFSTALHIFAFAVLRLYAIKKPFEIRSLKVIKIKILAFGIWVLCFLSGFVPMFIFTKAETPDRNSNKQNARWPACTIDQYHVSAYGVYANIAFPLFLYVPGVGVIILSLIIVSMVLYNKKSSVTTTPQSRKKEKKDAQAIMQLIMIATLFLLGYAPISAYELWSLQKWPSTFYYFKLDYWFGMVSYITLRFSETMNPVFYNLGSSKLRSETMNLLYKSCGLNCMKPDQDTSISSTSVSSRGTLPRVTNISGNVPA